MEHVEKIYIKNTSDLGNEFFYFYNWIKEKFNISLIINESNSLRHNIVLELSEGNNISLNELNSCEVIFHIIRNSHNKKDNWGNEFENEQDVEENPFKIVQIEELKQFLKNILLQKKKLENDFFEKIENEMIKKNNNIFAKDKLRYVDFLLFCILKKNKIEKINPKYENLNNWFLKNNISIKEESMSSFTNTNFIHQIIEDDLKKKKHSFVITRFPPEPNGYLHLGHAKSICLNFGLSQKYGGKTHLRFDDTNPVTEDIRYINSIQEDVKWLGFNWNEHLYYASDYFDQLYEWALQLIKQGDAYVDDQSIEEIRKNRGSLKEPGINSPYRNRSIEENLILFENMKLGKYKDGEKVLRAKIDMSSGNINLRDPVLYRIMNKIHPKTKNKWVIYPMYDFAHGQSDSIEKITHSICTLEFETHRPLYEWFQEKLGIFKTRQIEFARLNVSYMVMSKRKLLTLVNEKWVNDWDDPRMPTISGMRRRGYSPDAIKDFCNKVGVAKRENMISYELLELCAREDMNKKAIRLFCVLKPLKVVITNFDDNLYNNTNYYELTALNHPKNEQMGTRKIKFEKEIYIDHDDFQENPASNFYRLAPNRTVRLRYGFCIKCNEVIKDESSGKIIELRCTYDPDSKSGNPSTSNTTETGENVKKVKATIHWVSAKNSHEAEFRMYDKLFLKANPESNDDTYNVEKIMKKFTTELENNPNNNDGITMENDLDKTYENEYYLDTENKNDDQEKLKTDNDNKSGWRKYINKNSLVVHHGLVENYSKNCNVGCPIQFERIGFFVKDKDSTDDAPIFNLTVELVENASIKKNKKEDFIQKEMDKLKREQIANMRKMKKEQKRLKDQVKLEVA
ncbi:glutamine--tRNA ligase, putative [Plasmodium berghei]|uniref:glutamine--tRNA ligase n=3 Tax=Plasmodium berghei TaxID=5821 RepID=A0A509AP37_PLABA|nr:glutamine--tRNA ligase, putative [Plasmodium berghei ANKA]CXJ00601.1 glutamine--tRNA ligase, putative [Plasmodium berghei]SCM18537.1 glutamine--tRNA ligase, putative [Plasmodium berghei]VUC57853.1 glutamine--tRNA ligase, putative [Plasmodium berghei ANKA]|eukprot:XP_034423623.1 glutamine--tRNA ligase, putative [Plasmodium berghei ANKA]